MPLTQAKVVPGRGEGTWTYWAMTEAFGFGERHQKLGGTPPTRIEPWLTQHVLSFLLRHYPEAYDRPLGQAGAGRG